MATSNKHQLQQRDKVLLAARKCFIRHGFHATGMAEIAKACRMSAGNIYHYYPHKHAIVQAITDEFRSRMLPALTPLADHANPEEALVQMMRLSLMEIATNSNARLWMEISAEASRNQAIRKIWLTVDRDLRQLLERLILRVIQARQLPPTTDCEATSLWLVALLDGAIARLSVEPHLELARLQNTLAQTVRGFVRIGQI